jgi:hypothetical protein
VRAVSGAAARTQRRRRAHLGALRGLRGRGRHRGVVDGVGREGGVRALFGCGHPRARVRHATAAAASLLRLLRLLLLLRLPLGLEPLRLAAARARVLQAALPLGLCARR